MMLTIFFAFMVAQLIMAGPMAIPNDVSKETRAIVESIYHVEVFNSSDFSYIMFMHRLGGGQQESRCYTEIRGKESIVDAPDAEEPGSAWGREPSLYHRWACQLHEAEFSFRDTAIWLYTESRDDPWICNYWHKFDFSSPEVTFIGNGMKRTYFPDLTVVRQEAVC
ncbi:hypothetical protein EJ05DRAFT_513367 [Pseudovirgaria hyperparasitica]|uniref:AA1-like domain-containing protein n=1 Tax=Pseudovirgaria hyperparasitica TaxID=470096 RepID=A0A6A6W0E1_9PEZI|nr:uncharacterized protein EJ05DRAFT_513367 [Pseudovirgaria hyperparasitica]KAF2755047.1 hypothetical protein EJ05DRAFT_513367 [Pseudovirgaria hyperparasitica]